VLRYLKFHRAARGNGGIRANWEDVSAAQIYTHVLQKSDIGVRSPLDG
jgi:hypothetical protein